MRPRATVRPAHRLLESTPSRRGPAIEEWVRRRLGSIRHERRVRDLALDLFDLTLHRHGLTASDRRLLELAALLHDVGRSIDDDGHEKHGARLVLNEPALPLNRTERRAIAFLTRYHRGTVPPAGQEKHLDQCNDPESLRLLLGLLRAADALDGRSLQPPHVRMLLWNDRLHIRCILAEPSEKAQRVYARTRKFQLLEETLQCQAVIEVLLDSGVSQRPLRLAA